MRRLLLHLPQSDRTVVGLLLLAILVSGSAWPARGRVMGDYFVLHLALFAAFSTSTYFFARHERRNAVRFLRPLATVAVICSLYTSLGKLGVAAMPYLADGALGRIDTWVFGVNPSFWIQRYQTPGWVEFFSFFYGAFIPYINISLALNCLGRPPVDRDQFLTGWVFTYAISFMGYLFLPAHGPIVYYAADYEVSLTGNYFYNLVLDGVESSGGLQGAFPSLHVGGSVYLCLYDLRVNRLRGLTFLPLVLLIYVATIFLRYHYVIDLIAGTVIAASCIPLGQWAFLHWARRRETAGLPALPGGEADALPNVPGLGPAGASRFLPANGS